jgi:mannose-6-phosphate isomerase-like protein (cupin superfamily)
MRRITPIMIAALLAPAAALAQPAASPAASVSTFATSAEVQALIEKAKTGLKPGQVMLSQPVVRLAPYAAMLEYRVAPTPPSVHVTNAEFIHVIVGGGTMIVGGLLVDPKPSGANISGSAISGGTTHKLAAGDMLFIPEGTPHWFQAIDGTLFALTIKMPRPVPGEAK